jgi:hypothetical protein
MVEFEGALAFVRIVSSRGVIDCDIVERKRFPAMDACRKNIEVDDSSS